MASKRALQQHNDAIRRSVRVHDLIRKLESHVLDGEELSTSQIQAANSLLDRTLGKVQNVDLSGQIESNQTITVTLGNPLPQPKTVADGSAEPDAAVQCLRSTPEGRQDGVSDTLADEANAGVPAEKS